MKRVSIVGVGALGSHAGLLLRNAAELRVVDFDRVEQKNVESQFHARGGVTKHKVTAFQQAMQLLFGVRVEALPRRVVAENVAEVLAGSDLVLDCLDDGAARRVVQRHVRERHLPCLHGALAPDGVMGRVVWDPDFVIDDAMPGAATCRTGDHLPFIAVVASYLARAAQEFLASGATLGFAVTPRGGAVVL